MQMLYTCLQFLRKIIRYSVGGYHTCLSRRKPGFESRYRKTKCASFVLCSHASFYLSCMYHRTTTRLHTSLYTTKHAPYTIKHDTFGLFNKISSTLGSWISHYNSTTTSCTIGHQTVIFLDPLPHSTNTITWCSCSQLRIDVYQSRPNTLRYSLHVHICLSLHHHICITGVTSLNLRP